MAAVAAAPSPSFLPLSNQPSQSPILTSSADSSVNSASARLFLTRIFDSGRRALSNARPWPELVDRSAFSRPDSLSDAAARLKKNLSYFRLNYAAIISVSLATSLLSHPITLVALLLLISAWCFLYLFRNSSEQGPLVILGRTFTDREVLGGLVLVSVLSVFLTSVVSIIISALLVGVAVVCAHGAFRVPEDLFLDDMEGGGGGGGNGGPTGAAAGLLSFLGGAASSVAATAARV